MVDLDPQMDIIAPLKELLRNIEAFSQHASGVTLRGYQALIARAIVESVVKRRGLTFVVMLPRQSGKNELQAQLQAYLLTLFSQLHGELVMISPTWKPQSQNAMRRLERTLKRNLLTRDRWQKRDGYVFSVDTTNCYFLSGGPETNIVGATATCCSTSTRPGISCLPSSTRISAPWAPAPT
jgi:phage terminase large subunit-like protein